MQNKESSEGSPPLKGMTFFTTIVNEIMSTNNKIKNKVNKPKSETSTERRKRTVLTDKLYNGLKQENTDQGFNA